MECAGAAVRLLWVFGLVFGAGMARRGLLPTQFRVRPVGSLSAGMQPLVGKSGECRPVPAAAGHRVSAHALATASLLAAFVCLATLDSEVLAADSGSGSLTQYTKSSESPLPPRLSTWDLFGRIQRLEDTSFTKEDAKAMEARIEARMDKAEARMEARMDKAEAERKEDAKAMEARMDKADARMQENFRLSTFLTIVSLFLSLAANERFVAKLFPQR